MKRLHRIVVLVFAMWFGTAATVGSVAADPGGTQRRLGDSVPRCLSLDEALELALAQNHDIRKAREYSNWVYGKYLEERAQALPQVALDSGIRRDFTHEKRTGVFSLDPADPFVPGTIGKTTDVAGFALEVTQPLFTWGKLSAAIRAARMGLHSADEQLRLYRQAALKDVTAAFCDVLLAKALARIADQNLVQHERHWHEAGKKRALGTATPYDVLAAQVALANARPQAIRANNAVRLARDRLQFLLGAGCGEVDAEGTLEIAPERLPVYEEVVQSALQNRPEIRAQEIVIGINVELLEIARAGNKPDVFFSGSYGQYRAEFDPNSVKNENWSAGIFLSFPLFDGLRTQGKVRQSASELADSRLAMDKTREAIVIEARMALDRVEEALAIIAALEGTVQQAQELLNMAEKGFAYGVKTRLEVEDALLNLNASKGSLARAARDYRVALTDLEWVKGCLGEIETSLPPVK